MEVLGNDHERTLTSMGNLALAYWNLGKFKEAEEMQVRVLEGTKKISGEEHVETLLSMNNLAYTKKDLHRDEEAIALMERCFALRKQVLGPEDPATKRSLAALIEWRNETPGQNDASDGDTTSHPNETVEQDETPPQEGYAAQDAQSGQTQAPKRSNQKRALSESHVLSGRLAQRPRFTDHDGISHHVFEKEP